MIEDDVVLPQDLRCCKIRGINSVCHSRACLLKLSHNCGCIRVRSDELIMRAQRTRDHLDCPAKATHKGERV
eukprot:scaffold11746_cov109-Isochrysis_galbana.AAC.4